MSRTTRSVLYTLVFLIIAFGIFWLAYTIAKQVSDRGISAATLPSTMQSTSTEAVLPMTFDVVTTLADQEQGLGDRKSVPSNFGMLFVFQKQGNYGFWMKDMEVPIDILWLSDTGTIEKIDPSVATSTYPEILYPPTPVKYVLETAAGESAQRGWKIGTHLALPLPYGK